jgi:hypothetical protein
MSFLQRFSDNNVTTLVDAATIAIDMAQGAHFQVTLAGNRTLGNPTNDTAVKEVWIAVRQDATGSRTISFDTNWIAADASVDVNPAANSVSVVYAISRNFGSGVKWYYTVEHAAESGGGGGGVSVIQLSSGSRVSTDLRQTEVIYGSFYFDPTLYSSPTVTLRLVGSYSSVDTGSSFELRLYDMGASAAFSPVRRSTVSIPYASVNIEAAVSQALTLTGSPGVNTNTIFNTARVYEVRLYLNTADTSAFAIAGWAGLIVSV